MNLTVVIPVYGPWQPHPVIDALLPLAPLEILVVDSSTGPTPVPEHPLVRLIHLPERAYPGAARNAGWKAARGEFVLFVDADVELTGQARAFVAGHIAGSADDMAFGLYSRRAPNDNVITRVLVAMQHYRYQTEFARHAVRYGLSSHMLVRKSLSARIGFFNPHLRMHEDKELCIRACNAGVSVNVYPEFEARHLKRYTLLTLLQDHLHKSHLAVKTMADDPGIFRRTENQLGPRYKATLLGTVAVPLAAAVLVALGLVPIAPSVAVVALTLLIPLLFCREVFRTLSTREKIAGVLLWPIMGGAITAGAGAAMLRTFAHTTFRHTVGFRTVLVCAGRLIRRSGMPVSLIYFVTARCNLRCAHCFYTETLDRQGPGEQSLAQIEKTTAEVGPLLWFAFAGGEPFLRDDLADLFRIVTKNCAPLVITIPTNGWHVDRVFLRTLEMLQLPDHGQLVVQVSIDGPEDVHDLIRGAGSWKRLCETMNKLRELRSVYPSLSIGIITVVTEYNYRSYPAFIDTLVEQFQPNKISVNLVRTFPQPSSPLPEHTLDAYARAVERYESLVAQRKLPGLSRWGDRIERARESLQKELICRTARSNEFVVPCTAGSLIYTVWEDGRVGPCEMLPDTIGNVLSPDEQGDFRRFVRSRRAKALRERIEKEQCRCTYECAMTNNALFGFSLFGKAVWRIIFTTIRH